jgi:hypothetical protein
MMSPILVSWGAEIVLEEGSTPNEKSVLGTLLELRPFNMFLE